MRSFLALRAAGDWRKYAGKVGPVRSLHHFTKAALDALEKNAADVGHKKPLAVVLHTSVDHKGAFHRDPNMAEVAADPGNDSHWRIMAAESGEAPPNASSIAAMGEHARSDTPDRPSRERQAAAVTAPGSARARSAGPTPAQALALQRTAGNRAATRVLSRWAAHPDKDKKGVLLPEAMAAEFLKFNPPLSK